MRSRLLVCPLVLASVPVVAAPQEPKPDDKKNNNTITVTGCVDGGYLRVHEVDTVGSYTERYRIAGAKQLLKEMRTKQQGHVLELTGRVISAPGTEHMGHTTQIGKKTTVYTGAKEIPRVPSGDNTSTLEVSSYRAMAESCKGKL